MSQRLQSLLLYNKSLNFKSQSQNPSPSRRLSLLLPHSLKIHQLRSSKNSQRLLLNNLQLHNSQNSLRLSQSLALKSRPPPRRTLHHPRPPRHPTLPLSQQ